MNETKPQPTRNISQPPNLPTHIPNSNGLPNSCSASTSAAQINHHTFTTPTKNDNNIKSQASQPPTPQYKTLQIIPQPNHVVSTPHGNCVVVQQVSNSNHSLSFQQISSPEHSQNQPGQTVYRQKGQPFVNSRPQQVNPGNASAPNQNGDGNGANSQQPQISARYTQIHQLQDGRQLQMIQIPNNAQYVQLSNAPGQNGQPSQIMTYVHPQQQQFVARNGGQTQNVIIASQAQDGSRTLQAVPAQIHTIQHTVSPQNASFHLTKSSLKNVKPLNPATQAPNQNRKQELAQNNGTQNTPVVQQQIQNNSDGTQLIPQIIESPKVRPKAKTTPNKAKPKILKSSPPTQQITNNNGQPTATIQQITLPANAQIRLQNPNFLKGKEKGTPIQARAIASFVQIPSSAQPQKQLQLQDNLQKPHQLQIIQQHIPPNSMVQTSLQKNPSMSQQIVLKSESQQQISQDNSNQNAQQNQLPPNSSSQSTIAQSSQVLISTATVPSNSKPRASIVQLKPAAVTDVVSPIPTDPYSSAMNKLNLDLTGGDPKDSYRVLKKHFKFLVYENECYQGQLRDSHQRLLKLERDNNYLMDRLLKYETLSDSDGDESDSSIKTIEDKTLTQKATKKRSAPKKDPSVPSKRKKPSTDASNAASVSKTITTTTKVATTTTPAVTVKAAVSIKDSPSSSKPSVSPAAAISQSNTSNNHSTSSSTLSVFQTNMPLPSVYKPFPPSNTSTLSTPSTPTTTDSSFITSSLPKTNGPVVSKPKPVLSVPKPAPPKAKVIIAELPKVVKEEVFRPKLHISPTTSTVSSSSGMSDTSAVEPKLYTVVTRPPAPLRNPTPQANATVTYSNLKPNAMIPRPLGQMPQTRMHPPRPRIQIIQPQIGQQQTPYNVQPPKFRPHLKETPATLKKESPSKPNS